MRNEMLQRLGGAARTGDQRQVEPRSRALVQVAAAITRHRGSKCCEEIAQLTRVGGLEADTDQAILIAFEGGRDLDGLAVIDLEADKIAWNLGSLVENTSSIPTTPC